MKIRGGVLALLSGLMPLCGCGKPEPTVPATVHGLVTYQGRPLAGGLIVFAPDKEKGNTGKSLSAKIDSSGNYKLSHEGNATVTPGWYRVAIADPPDVFTEASGYPRFPNALRRPDKSGIEREVVSAKDNGIDFVIEVSGE